MTDAHETLAERELRLVGDLSRVHRQISDLLPPATEPLSPDRPVEAKPLQLDEYRRLRAEEQRLENELGDVRRRPATGER